MSVRDAIEKYSRKQLKDNTGPRRKNSKPEKLVVSECMKWFNEFGFSMTVVESKAVYSASAGRYLSGQAAAGFPDSVGCTPFGVGCFVEFKAKGKVATLRDGQREFLKEKILKGCFACVVDSMTMLQGIYCQWCNLKEQDRKVAYLLSKLPVKKSRESDKELSFLD